MALVLYEGDDGVEEVGDEPCHEEWDEHIAEPQDEEVGRCEDDDADEDAHHAVESVGFLFHVCEGCFVFFVE